MRGIIELSISALNIITITHENYKVPPIRTRRDSNSTIDNNVIGMK